MTWDSFEARDDTPGRAEPIELVGTNLRLTGTINIGRFARLSDLINASSGYLRVSDARLLNRSGEPTSLVLAELMVDQDEVSFIAQLEPTAPAAGSGTSFVDPGFGGSVESRQPRSFVMFTPGHTVTGQVHVFGATDLAGFVDSTDPRFVPVTDVTTHSLADRRIVSRYQFVLINRTQMIAASEIGRRDDIPEDAPQV